MTILSVSQDPNAHKFYDVDWTDWLTARGMAAGALTGAVFTIVSGTGTITSSTVVGAIARVYFKDIALGDETVIQCRASFTPPQGAIALVDDYTFKIVGRAA